MPPCPNCGSSAQFKISTPLYYKNGGWENAGTADLRVNGNVMVVKLPLSAIGKSSKDLAIEFKVSDNVTNYDDIMDYYVTGDSAPIGRLSYSYGK